MMASAHLGPATKRFKPSPDAPKEVKNAIGNSVAPLSQPSSNGDPFFDSDDDHIEIPSDTIAALTLLKAEFPKLQGVSIRFASNKLC